MLMVFTSFFLWAKVFAELKLSSVAGKPVRYEETGVLA